MEWKIITLRYRACLDYLKKLNPLRPMRLRVRERFSELKTMLRTYVCHQFGSQKREEGLSLQSCETQPKHMDLNCFDKSQ